MPVLNRLLPIMLWLASVVTIWTVLVVLITVRDVGDQTNFWALERLAAYAIFVLAPVITFVPISRRLRIPLYDLEAIIGWSTLAFAVSFIDPGTNPPPLALLIVLVSLVISLATIFTLVSYAFGHRVFARRSHRYDFVRARREGYLISMFIVGCLLLSALGVFTLVNVALFGILLLLIEIFLLSRGPAPRTSTERTGTP